MTTLRSLTPAQIRMMIRLDNGQTHEDSVGVEIGDLSKEWFDVCSDLMELGLVDLDEGWGSTFWFRLTEAGRDVQETGEV